MVVSRMYVTTPPRFAYPLAIQVDETRGNETVQSSLYSSMSHRLLLPPSRALYRDTHDIYERPMCRNDDYRGRFCTPRRVCSQRVTALSAPEQRRCTSQPTIDATLDSHV
jgi:hypothetical protein